MTTHRRYRSRGLVVGLCSFGLCALGLTACQTTSSTGQTYETSGGYYETYSNANFMDNATDSPFYEDYTDARATEGGGGGVTVPETYHVGAYHSPVASKDRDRSWVAQQNPQEFTVQIADSEKAAQVAGQLVQTPKKEHSAEIQYYRNGNPHYKGLYGSYSSYDAAQKALQSLPENVRKQANIRTWSEIQTSVGE